MLFKHVAHKVISNRVVMEGDVLISAASPHSVVSVFNRPCHGQSENLTHSIGINQIVVCVCTWAVHMHDLSEGHGER